MNKNLNIWFCLGIAGILFSLGTIAELLSIRIVCLFSYLNFAYYSVILKGFSLIVFVVSFLLTALCIKNRKHVIWFVLLYGLAFILPSLIGIPRMIDSMGGENDRLIYPIYSFLIVFIDSWFAIVLYLGFDWLNKEKRTKELEKQNLQSELSLLKNQINPHFLFNTLNNIDSLVKRNPDQASSSIIELSDMMRYMIYETNTGKVPLQKELDYIENYLELQKLQYVNPELVKYSINGNPENKLIAPMLFIPFIENAFKHGTNKETRYAIRIVIRIELNTVYFESVNYAGKEAISKDASSGIGLETVKRRLNILYPDNHKLEIQQKNDLFCVSLIIQFND